MTSHYLLDTDTCSYSIRTRDRILQARIHSVPSLNLRVSVITQAELLYGIRRFPQGHIRKREVDSFLRISQVVAWDSLAAEAYADIRHTLTTSGRIIGEMDMMIAAHALATGAILVSNNTRHFERLVPPLQLENWTHS